jgi:hypothetical protein
LAASGLFLSAAITQGKAMAANNVQNAIVIGSSKTIFAYDTHSRSSLDQNSHH